MANGGNFQEHFPESTSLHQHYPELCFDDDVAMLDVTDQAPTFTLNTQDCLSLNNTACLPAKFPAQSDVNASYTATMTLDDASQFRSTVLGSNVNTGGHLSQDYSTQALPVSYFNTDSSAGYNNGMALLNDPFFQSPPHVDFTLKAVTQLHRPPSEMPHSGLNNVHTQDLPVLDAPSGAYSRASSGRHTTSLNPPIEIQYATAEDWERNRALFTRLYRDEHKTLKEVKSIMKERHGFNATDKMYKKRIHDWQLHKNCKALEKEEILRCIETHRKLGVDLGKPMVNGRTVKMHLIERHRKEKRKARSPSPISPDPTTTDRNDVQSVGRAHPRGPKRSALISFSQIKDPSDYRDCEALIFYIDQYYNSKLEKDPLMAWNAWEESSRNWRTKISYTFQGETYTCTFDINAGIFERHDVVDRLLVGNRTREAWRMIEEAAEMVRPSILQQSPWLVGNLLVYLSSQSSRTHNGVKLQLLHLISGMALVVQGERHPFSNLCRLLHVLHGKRDVVELGLRKMRDVLKQRLGQSHSASTLVQYCHCRSLRNQQRYDDAERSFLDLSETYERFRGRNAFLTRAALHHLAELYYARAMHSKAEDILLDLLERGKKLGGGDQINILAKHLQGAIYFQRGDYRAAEAIFWSALSNSLLYRGPKDPRTIRLWISFQKCYETSMYLPPSSDAFPEIPEEPLRRFARPRSSSLPLANSRGYKASFCYEASA